ncbi:ComF family protein [Flavobacterium crassostreae]|uniref:Amidophosphoribosyltransferase n=1 Tax=Flavobacterium crassostreae TaxID=1763534 RepID=A0A1B9E5T0_9FLAO|nr:ComF family protein [Flavobacterium crassostreae]OCB77324.1 amidophosphoribosyltransferase [Flavobacterium crassostreae]
MFLSILNLFFPKTCGGCNHILSSNETILCTLCRHTLPLTNHHLNPKNAVFNTFYGRIDVQFAAAFLYFRKKGIVQEMVHNLKYRGQQEIGQCLGNWVAEDWIATKELTAVDCIIPVPLHPRKFRERGYNQVSSFGLALSAKLNLEYNAALLIRNTYSKTQSKKDFSDRIQGNETTFDVIFSEKDHNKHYLLIDDVITTGATLEACSRALLKIPGTQISILCMAMSDY